MLVCRTQYLALRDTDAHVSVEIVCLAVLGWDARPVEEEDVASGVLEVELPLPGRAKQSDPLGLYRTATTPPRSRPSWGLVIWSTFRCSGGGDTSSKVTWKRGNLVVKELSTYFCDV